MPFKPKIVKSCFFSLKISTCFGLHHSWLSSLLLCSAARALLPLLLPLYSRRQPHPCLHRHIRPRQALHLIVLCNGVMKHTIEIPYFLSLSETRAFLLVLFNKLLLTPPLPFAWTSFFSFLNSSILTPFRFENLQDTQDELLVLYNASSTLPRKPTWSPFNLMDSDDDHTSKEEVGVANYQKEIGNRESVRNRKSAENGDRDKNSSMARNGEGTRRDLDGGDGERDLYLSRC
ncbi:hypothetical protein PIB30_066466 [Stylosanthes scabra]|uniref:Uncharacterized protein n=1 Tax=Stylosanthes scabra TaxID=79078 RepID=A0ABU6UL21_9FABA|nr:hypothetical protein [Stylosanthes scabra]